MMVAACSGADAGQRIAAPSSRNATLSLALVEVSAAREPTTVTVSCRGGALCRETVAPAENTDVIDEAKEDCGHRGGLTLATTCPRTNAVASCSLNGGAGPIRVFTYAQNDAKEQAEAVSTMDDLCNAADGTFEVVAK